MNPPVRFLLLSAFFFSLFSSCKKESSTDPFYVVKVTPVNATAVAYGDVKELIYFSPGTAFMRCTNACYRTTDGGQSWVNLNLVDSGSEQTVSCSFRGQEGMLSILPNSNSPAAPKLLKTTDGGTNWTVVNNTDKTEQIAFPNALVGYRTYHPGSLSTYPMLSKTVDGGLSWDTGVTMSNSPSMLCFFQ